MKKTILTFVLLCSITVINAQWTNTGDNTTSGKVTAKEYNFPNEYFDFSKMPRTQISPMSIKLFDDYNTYRPGGSSPDNNAYGTLLAINGRASHWENNIYFGAVSQKMYFRISKYALHTAENGVQGDYNNWRTLLDNMSDVKSSKLLKIEGNGLNYFSNGNLSVGTTTSKGRLHVNGSIYSQIGEGFKLFGDPDYFGQYKDGIIFQMEDVNATNGNTDGGFVFRGHTPTDGLSKEWMVIKTGGNVGIGTTTPDSKLDVAGVITSRSELRSKMSNPAILLDETDVPDKNWHIQVNGGDLKFYQVNDARSSWSQKMLLTSDGKLGIGTTTVPSNFKLAVAGKMISEEVTVKLQSTWPDYVFTNTYKLPTLEEVEQQISKNGHLANIPSAEEVEKNGIELGEMNKKLLEKIEELTLYTIQQQKEIKALKKQDSKLEKLEKENQELKDRLSKIEEMLSKK
ncbi:hypothetical protein EV195_10831 [Tenacibaculum skagerrakense]|uniref:Uncharacterized protein n=1 Tax=Tenacibaculum skagerrakense TaxID=186571 RepID=A0A4R2NPI0_9FLAO|nr:hypothetical protein [Tenacibaculum skagerrakense]TCP23562.1 hypothetical protein EV195_10831 [Tenacibaculum skagerrakense]